MKTVSLRGNPAGTTTFTSFPLHVHLTMQGLSEAAKQSVLQHGQVLHNAGGNMGQLIALIKADLASYKGAQGDLLDQLVGRGLEMVWICEPTTFAEFLQHRHETTPCTC